MARDLRMRPRPREPGRRPLTADQRDAVQQALQELHDQPQTGRHAAKENQ